MFLFIEKCLLMSGCKFAANKRKDALFILESYLADNPNEDADEAEVIYRAQVCLHIFMYDYKYVNFLYLYS